MLDKDKEIERSPKNLLHMLFLIFTHTFTKVDFVLDVPVKDESEVCLTPACQEGRDLQALQNLSASSVD